MAMRELNLLGDEIKVRMDKWIDPASNKKYLNTDQSGEIELMIKEYVTFLTTEKLYPDLHRAIWKRDQTTHVDGNYTRSGAYDKGNLSIKLINWGNFRDAEGNLVHNPENRPELWVGTYPDRNSMAVGHSHGNCFAAIVNGRGYQQPLKEVVVGGKRWAQNYGKEQTLRAGDVAYADDSVFLHNVYTKTSDAGYMNNLHIYYDNGDGGKYIRHYKRVPETVQGLQLYRSDDDEVHADRE